jgi:hypothetical protein
MIGRISSVKELKRCGVFSSDQVALTRVERGTREIRPGSVLRRTRVQACRPDRNVRQQLDMQPGPELPGEALREHRRDRRDGGVPQALLLSPHVHRSDVTVTAISVEGNRAVWIARDDFNKPRISEGDLSGTCARINWSTVDESATSAYVDDTGAYWSAGDRVMAKPTASK